MKTFPERRPSTQLPTQRIAIGEPVAQPVDCRNCSPANREACTTLMTYGDRTGTLPDMRDQGLCVQAIETEI